MTATEKKKENPDRNRVTNAAFVQSFVKRLILPKATQLNIST